MLERQRWAVLKELTAQGAGNPLTERSDETFDAFLLLRPSRLLTGRLVLNERVCRAVCCLLRISTGQCEKKNIEEII